MTSARMRPVLPESAKTRWGVSRSIAQAAELDAILRMRFVVHPVVNELPEADRFVVWDYLDQQPREDITDLVSALVAGSGGRVGAAGSLLLRLAQFHEKSVAPAARQAASLVKANNERQSLRDAAISWVLSEPSLQYKRDYVAALVKKYGIKHGRAEQWLKYAIECGAFTPPDTYSQRGRPRK